jgi:hypothetical protein
MTGNLILFARDPGNANQLVALNELIRAQMAGRDSDTPTAGAARLVAELAGGRAPDQILVFGSGVGAQVLAAAGIKVVSDPADAVHQDPVELFRAQRVDTVVTGLSDRDDRTPQTLWHAAAMCGAKSVALADDTTIATKHAKTDLMERFRDRDGREIFPDLLCVVDEKSRDAIVAAGIPEQTVRVIGNLHLRRFCQLAQSIDRHRIEAVRREWNATDESTIVLYASEPITQMQKHGKQRDHDELRLLSELIDRVRTNRLEDAVPCDGNTIVVVRPHPRDEVAKFKPYLSDDAPRTIISRVGSSAEAILAADAVVGITSMLLVEAAALNRPSVSLIDFDPQAAARST